jgi:hypothetical protein
MHGKGLQAGQDRQMNRPCEMGCGRIAEGKHHKFSQTNRNRALYGKLLDDPRNIMYLCSVCHENKPVIKYSEKEFCAALNIEVRSKVGKFKEGR